MHLLAVGTRMPAWLAAGFDEYAKRLPRECALVLHEIAAAKRSGRGSEQRALELEGERLVARIPAASHIIALDLQGEPWTTAELAGRLRGWLSSGQPVALLIGGPDGLSWRCLDRAYARWSLSPLTLPHGLVRLLVAEQLYRAWSMLTNHPYHRA